MSNSKSNVIIPIVSALGQANNELWFNFHLDFDALTAKWTLTALGIEIPYPAYKALVGKADALLELIIKSRLTGKMKEADELRDEDIRGLRAAAKAFLNSSNPQKKEAAITFMILLDKYGDFTRKSYDAQSAMTYNFLQELKGKYSEEIKTLELTEWVDALELHNNQFVALDRERYVEKTEKPDQTLVEVRRKVDASYSDLIKVIEASMIINPDHKLDDFVKELNIIIKHYKTVFAQGKGRKNKEK
jgi:hypothetical protein